MLLLNVAAVSLIKGVNKRLVLPKPPGYVCILVYVSLHACVLRAKFEVI